MPVMIGAALIATAILLAALISIVGTRFIGMDSPSEDSVWLIDRLTGSVSGVKRQTRQSLVRSGQRPGEHRPAAETLGQVARPFTE
jgi:hypothetical protein